MEDNNLPPGFRFHPTDEELITYYLSNKVSDFSFSSRAIIDVDLNKCEPWDLPARASMGEKEWYFFSQRDRKYPTGLRTNRATESGYWKTTGKDKEIYRGEVLVGMKKTLVFYKGRAPKGEKTNWVMHEYRHESKLSFKPMKPDGDQEEWVVCRVFQKSTIMRKPLASCSSPQSMESPCNTNTITNEFGDIEVQNTSEMPTTLTNMINNNPPSLSNFNINADNINNWLLPSDSATTLASLANWPAAASTLLGSNLSVNSLLLGTLQLFQSRQVANNDYNSLLLTQGATQVGDNNNVGLSFGGLSSASSSRAAFDTIQDQQSQEQPFDLDSGIW